MILSHNTSSCKYKMSSIASSSNFWRKMIWKAETHQRNENSTIGLSLSMDSFFFMKLLMNRLRLFVQIVMLYCKNIPKESSNRSEKTKQNTQLMESVLEQQCKVGTLPMPVSTSFSVLLFWTDSECGQNIFGEHLQLSECSN